MMLPNTNDLLDGIWMDLVPSFPTCVDFGMHDVSTQTRVFGALQYGIKHEHFTQVELDAALGDGPMLTQLVNRPDNPYGHELTITTMWDDLPPEEDDDV